MIVVSNTTPLISLSLLNQLSLLEIIFKEIHIPVEVYEELVIKGQREHGAKEISKSKWIIIHRVFREDKSEALLKLDSADAQTIILAEDLKANLVLLDDKDARHAAKAKGIKTLGTVGILMVAFKHRLIPSLNTVEEYIKYLNDKGQWVDESVFEKALELEKIGYYKKFLKCNFNS
ncbi:MAG: DUF3368 domain-containing protein [bacterium]